MNLLALYIAAVGVYMLTISFMISTSNTKSHILLRGVPIVLGCSLIFIGLVKSGMITVVVNTPL